MKKILSIVLAVAMVLGISFIAVPAQPALAATNASISASGSHCIGDEITLIIQVPDAGQGEKYDATYSVNNTALVEGLASGASGMTAGNSVSTKCTAKASGTVTFTVTFTPSVSVSGVTTTASCSYEIKSPELKLSSAEVTYSPDDTSESASVNNKPTGGTGTFASSDTNVAEIDSDTGKITVKGAGTTTISYTHKNGEETDVELSKVFTVKKAKASLSVKDSEITLHVDDVKNVTISKSGIPSDMYSEIALDNSKASVATVEADTDYTNLKITAKEVGTTVARISFPQTSKNYEETSAKITINVIDKNTPILTLNPTSMSLKKGDAKALTVSVDNSSNNNVLLKVTGSKSNSYRGVAIDGYTSKNGVYVLVNGSNSVTLTPKYNGTYYVTASLNGAEAKCVVTVTGCNTLPQTGPDFTLVYVFAGLLLASLVVLAYVNIKRKKAVQ